MNQQTTHVTFTCDTEGMYPRIYPQSSTSCWETGVIGRTPQGDFGVPHLMSMLEEAGARGTFFIDINVVNCVGRASVEKTCREMIDRGHDLQLHLHLHHGWDIEHPERWGWIRAQDKGNTALFRETFLHAADQFEDICKYRATVYRAGGYRLLPEMVETLKEAGIEADATIWPDSRRRVDFPDDIRWRNAPFYYEGLLILPITHYIETRKYAKPAIRQLNFSMRRRHIYESLLELPEISDLGLISFISHSSSFMEYGHDHTYAVMLKQILAVHPENQSMRIRDMYKGWIDSQERPKAMTNRPDTVRMEEYKGFFKSLSEHFHLKLITCQDYVKGVQAGTIDLPKRSRSVYSLPRYDFQTRDARMDYKRRYDLKYLIELDNEYRSLSEEEAPYTRPPKEIEKALKSHGNRG